MLGTRSAPAVGNEWTRGRGRASGQGECAKGVHNCRGRHRLRCLLLEQNCKGKPTLQFQQEIVVTLHGTAP